jgi:type II secretory pathway component PulF
MRIFTEDVAEFYRELALLAESSMPLPESLEQMAKNAKNPEFKRILKELEDNTSAGISLSDAMARHPQIFLPYHQKMIGVGERSGNLPDILNDIAHSLHFQMQLASMAKDIMTYPLFIITIAFLLFFGIMYFIIPQFELIFADLFEGVALPPLTQFVFKFSALIRNLWWLVMILVVAHIAFSCWLLSDCIVPRKIFLSIISSFPMANILFYNLSMSKICSLWALMMKQNTPNETSLEVIAGLMDDKRLSNALKRVAEKCKRGNDLVSCISEEGDISELVGMTIKHSPERNLAGQLSKLAELFRQRATMGFRRVGIVWEIFGLMAMAGFIGCVLLLVFIPLLSNFF